MKNVRLSVVIPGYETSESDWRRCLNSVLANLGPDDEVVCVDDASPHPALAPKEYAEEDARVRLIRLQVNGGQAKARNCGLAASSGGLVAFVDSDDELLPGIYSKAIALYQKRQCDVIVYGVRTVWDKNGLYKEDALPLCDMGVLDADGLARLYKACLFNYPWNKVYRRKFLEQHDIRFVENATPREDEVFNLDCVLAGATWSVCESIGQVYHRQDGTSLARYRRNGDVANRTVSERWGACHKKLGDAKELPLSQFVANQQQLDRAEWANIWRRATPYSLVARWRWLRQHPEVGGAMKFVSKFCFTALRRFFYLRPVRRWQVRRLYPQVREV